MKRCALYVLLGAIGLPLAAAVLVASLAAPVAIAGWLGIEPAWGGLAYVMAVGGFIGFSEYKEKRRREMRGY